MFETRRPAAQAEELVEEYLPLARRLAMRYRYTSEPIEDLLSWVRSAVGSVTTASMARFGPVEVGALAATQLINRQNAVLLDLRESKDYEGGHVPNAVHIPLSQLAGRAGELLALSHPRSPVPG